MAEFHLVVTAPFGDYGRGEQITDAAAVEAVLAEHGHHVVKITPPDVAKPSASTSDTHSTESDASPNTSTEA